MKTRAYNQEIEYHKGIGKWVMIIRPPNNCITITFIALADTLEDSVSLIKSKIWKGYW